MKRPRSSIAALFTAATAVLSPSPLLPLASSQSLRASYSPSTVDGEGSSGGSFVETQQQQLQQQQQQTADTSVPLTVKLSTSSHHRGHIAAPNNNNNNNSNYSNNYKKSKQTNPLGSADGTTNGNGSMPEIPLVGIGVGNLPHNKIPYILANALGGGGSNSNSNSNNKALKEMNYKLIDTSHTSALEVLVGRSLSRLLTTTNTNNTSNYHVMIKIWHTHLGYERTMMSIQDSLADIIPGSNPAAKKVANGMMSSSSISGSRSSMGKSSSSTNNNNNNNKSIRIHAILQYPRCYDTLFQSQTYLSQSSHTSSSSSSNNSPPFSSCQDEEHALDSTVKSAGPSPLLDKDNAWKRSYRALEELYHHGSLESIGIANFGPSDMTLLYDIATVGPHVYQGSLRALLLEQELVEGLVKHGVHYQVYDAPSAVVRGREKAPRAYAKLERMGARHGGIEEEDYASSSSSSSQGGGGGGGFTSSSSYGYSAVQLVLGWLVQRGVGVIPGTKDVTHLIENGPLSLAEIPNFSPRENLDIEMAVLALVQGVDLEDENVVRRNNIMNNNNVPGMGEFGSQEIYINGQPLLDNYGANREEDDDEGVVATFFNALRRNIRIFHVHPNTGQQLQISQSIPPGRSGRLIVNPSDVLIAYDGHGVAVRKFLVEGDHGGRVDFSVEL